MYLKSFIILHLDLAQAAVGVADLEHTRIAATPHLEFRKIEIYFYVFELLYFMVEKERRFSVFSITILQGICVEIFLQNSMVGCRQKS